MSQPFVSNQPFMPAYLRVPARTACGGCQVKCSGLNECHNPRTPRPPHPCCRRLPRKEESCSTVERIPKRKCKCSRDHDMSLTRDMTASSQVHSTNFFDNSSESQHYSKTKSHHSERSNYASACLSRSMTRSSQVME